MAGFAPSDSTNTGFASDLSTSSRVRMAVDLYAVLLLGAVQNQFGIAITASESSIGPGVLAGADIPGVLGNSIDASPAAPGFRELKEWMALLSYWGQGSKARSPRSMRPPPTSFNLAASARLSRHGMPVSPSRAPGSSLARSVRCRVPLRIKDVPIAGGASVDTKSRTFRADIDVLRQSAPVPARAVGAAMGLSRFNTVEINSLTEIPRWPQRRRFRLV